MWGFLRRPKWIGLIAVSILLALLFIRLGFWQLDRLAQKRTLNHAVVAASNAAPVGINQLLSTHESPDRTDQFKPVIVKGHYDVDHQILVRNRTVDNRPGFLVLTPLITADHNAVLVARGWVAPNSRGANFAPAVPSITTEQVTIQGRTKLSEAGAQKEVHLGQFDSVARINVPQLAKTLRLPTYQAYLELIKQTPHDKKPLTILSNPPLDEGPHLSYAVQWFLFATMAVIGCGILLYREAKNRDQS